jgi:hypothetical protein
MILLCSGCVKKRRKMFKGAEVVLLARRGGANGSRQKELQLRSREESD